MDKQMEKIADDIVKNFEQQMAQVMENLQTAELAFDDLNALLDSSEGFGFSKGTWRRSGWRALDELRRVLEVCPELRELVRSLGRGGGKGPLRRAPE
ncbi:VWFA domain-containing protein, partial [Haematococcus lacustris]